MSGKWTRVTSMHNYKYYNTIKLHVCVTVEKMSTSKSIAISRYELMAPYMYVCTLGSVHVHVHACVPDKFEEAHEVAAVHSLSSTNGKPYFSIIVYLIRILLHLAVSDRRV